MKFCMQRRLLAGIVLLLLNISPILAASLYDVEMIIFTHNTSGLSGNELWRSRADTNERFTRRLTSIQGNRRVQAVQSSSGGRLATIAANLSQDPDFQILRHINWRQQSAPFSAAPLMGISQRSSSEELDGFARLYSKQLLFLDIFIRLQQNSGYGGSYFIEEKRRVKLKEIHYIDHPKFSIIATVWPAS